MKIKKLLAGGLAAALAGSTLAFGVAATLSTYVDAPASIPKIVIGSSAGDATEYPKDVAAAGDIGAAMAGYATTETIISGGVTTSVSNGADIATTNKKLYFRSLLSRARGTLTSTQLSAILESGTVADLDVSGSYNFDQYINIGNKQTEFDKNSGVFDDPTLYVAMGSNAAGAPLYNFTIVLAKALNISDTNVQGGTMEVANGEYTIGSGSQSGTSGASSVSKLVLLGGAGSVTLSVGDSSTVAIGDTEYAVEFISVTDSNTVNIQVDGDMDSIDSGTTKTFTSYSGDVEVYAKKVLVNANLGTGSIQLIVGSNKLTLNNHQKVKEGTNEDDVLGTHCYVTGDNSGITKIVISVAGKDASNNYIQAGTSMTDPVFGSFKVAFKGMTPARDDAARDTVTIDDSGTQYATIDLTDYRGYSKVITFVYNGTSQPQLNKSSNYAIHVLEGETISLNEYFLVAPEQESDFGHIMQLSQMTNIGGSNPSFTLKDVLSEATMQFYFSDDGKTDTSAFKTFYIDGQTYYGQNITSTQMNFTWGDTGAIDGDTGTKTIVFPLVRLAGGEYVTFVQNQTVARTINVSLGTPYILELPGGDCNLTLYNGTATGVDVKLYVNSSAITVAGAAEQVVAEYAAGQINWEIGVNVINATSKGWNYRVMQVAWAAPSTTYIAQSNNQNLVGVMVLQEEDNATTKDAVFAGLNYASTDGLRIDHESGSRTGASDGDSRGSNTYISDYLNTYGTQIEVTSGAEAQGKVVIKYPDDQAVATVAFGTDPSFSTGETGGTYNAAYQITSPVTWLDNQVTESASLAYDLILIGGPCANTVVASYTTGLIKEETNIFSSGKKALIIAGTTADDTRDLAALVMGGTMTYAT